MKKKAPITATEMRMILTEESRRDILRWVSEGGLDGQEITLYVSEFMIGNIAKIKAKITDVIPALTSTS